MKNTIDNSSDPLRILSDKCSHHAIVKFKGFCFMENIPIGVELAKVIEKAVKDTYGPLYDEAIEIREAEVVRLTDNKQYHKIGPFVKDSGLGKVQAYQKKIDYIPIPEKDLKPSFYKTPDAKAA